VVLVRNRQARARVPVSRAGRRGRGHV